MSKMIWELAEKYTDCVIWRCWIDDRKKYYLQATERQGKLVEMPSEGYAYECRDDAVHELALRMEARAPGIHTEADKQGDCHAALVRALDLARSVYRNAKDQESDALKKLWAASDALGVWERANHQEVW